MTDVGTTKRRSMTPARRLRIWEAHSGICVTCGIKIKTGEGWFVEHVRALELGGEDADANCGPAHLTCKAAKDAEDHGRAAKAKRVKQKHLSIKTRKQPIPSAGFPRKERKHADRQPLPPRNLFRKDDSHAE